jgi:hypothetical protein
MLRMWKERRGVWLYGELLQSYHKVRFEGVAGGGRRGDEVERLKVKVERDMQVQSGVAGGRFPELISKQDQAERV